MYGVADPGTPGNDEDLDFGDTERVANLRLQADAMQMETAGEHELVAGADYDQNFVNIMETIGWGGCALILFITFNTLILMGRVDWLPWPDYMFGVYISTFVGTFTVVTIGAGAAKVYGGVNISYTRKVAHFFSFFLPFGLYAIIPFTKNLTSYVLTFCCAFFCFMPLVSGIRNIPCMWPIRLAYASFDRREDRPLTLLWVVTQALFVYAVMLPCVIVLDTVLHDAVFILIPLIVTGIGDGLAEPVGRAFGYHKYRAAAMCTRKQYTRSIQGSLMLVVSGVAVISVMFAIGKVDLVQFLVGFFIIPIPMAVAEAKSPHSWDNPFLLLVGGVLAIVLSCLKFR